MTDRLAYVDGYRLRDLVDRLDRVLDTLELYDFNDDDPAAVKQRDLFRIERALEAAVAFLHELRLTLMRVLGVDPGVRGGLAIVSFENGVPEIIEAINIPTVGTGAKERVDVLAIHSFIEAHTPQHALIERAQAMPKQGASSGFKYGRAVGALEAVIACCAIPMTIAEPSRWKKFNHLHGGDKEPARQRALQLFPKDHGRAEAALIALAGNKAQP